MVNDNPRIVPFKQGVLVKELHYEANPEVIAELEELLEAARHGGLAGIAYATLYSDNGNGNRYVGYMSRSVVGSLFAVMTRLNEQLDE